MQIIGVERDSLLRHPHCTSWTCSQCCHAFSLRMLLRAWAAVGVWPESSGWGPFIQIDVLFIFYLFFFKKAESDSPRSIRWLRALPMAQNGNHSAQCWDLNRRHSSLTNWARQPRVACDLHLQIMWNSGICCTCNVGYGKGWGLSWSDGKG